MGMGMGTAMGTGWGWAGSAAGLQPVVPAQLPWRYVVEDIAS